jgi:hypothetical protein
LVVHVKPSSQTLLVGVKTQPVVESAPAVPGAQVPTSQVPRPTHRVWFGV